MTRGKNDTIAAPAILDRVAAGEASAVRECLDLYGNLVWSIARRYLRNRADAEDAVQEIFIDIWRSARRFDRTMGTEQSFIATITRRRLIDRVRRTGRGPVLVSRDDDEDPPPDPGVPATGEDAAEVGLVERAISTLEPRHQQVLALVLAEGFTHEQVAERLGVPLGTVKTWVRRGLVHIRHVLRVPATSAAGEVAREVSKAGALEGALAPDPGHPRGYWEAHATSGQYSAEGSLTQPRDRQ